MLYNIWFLFDIMSTRYCVKLIRAACRNYVQVYLRFFFLTSVKSHEELCIKLSSFLTKEKKFYQQGTFIEKNHKHCDIMERMI